MNETCARASVYAGGAVDGKAGLDGAAGLTVSLSSD